MAEWGAMNREYVRFFTAHRPARSAFGTTGLAMGARIELECIGSGRPTLSTRTGSRDGRECLT